MEAITQNLVGFLSGGAAWVVKFFLAVVVLIIGWFVAKVTARIVRQILLTTDLDEKIGHLVGTEAMADGGERPKRSLARIVEAIVYYILLIIVVIFALEVMGDTAVKLVLQNILGEIFLAVPKLLKAALILVCAWIIALILKNLAIRAMRKFQLGERLDKAIASEAPSKEKRDVAQSFGNFIFYFIMLFALLAVLQSLELGALVDPIKGMFAKVMAFLPNVVTAGVVLILGYFFARLCERVTTNFLEAAGINRFVEGVRFETVLKSVNVARVAGTVVFLVLMVPVLGITFEILDLPVITGVFGSMMTQVASAIPGILAAFVLLVVGLVAGRYLGDMAAQILKDVGFDVILNRIGLERLEPREDEEGKIPYTMSAVAGNLVMAVVVLFFVMEGFRLARLPLIADAIDKLLLFLPNVLIAFVILGLGFYLAKVVEQLAQRSFASDHTFEADIVGLVIRYAIIVFAFFMAFDQLGIAHSIVVNAFTILLGTVGLGLALAFGLGARDHARDYLEKLKNRKRDKDAD